MKTLMLSILAAAMLSGCAHMGKGCCCKKEKSCCSQSAEGHKGHKECGSECGTEKEKTEGK